MTDPLHPSRFITRRPARSYMRGQAWLGVALVVLGLATLYVLRGLLLSVILVVLGLLGLLLAFVFIIVGAGLILWRRRDWG